MIVLALTSREKGVKSVTIVANLGTKLTDVMPYMVVLLNLLWLPKLLMCNLLLWTILHLHLISQASLLFSMNFLNGTRIVIILVPPLLLNIGTFFVGPWVLGSGATNHISGNQSFLSSLSTTGYLPSVTIANGYRVPSHGVGIINIFPYLSIDNVIYVPGSPFNLLSISRLTRSLDYVISFTKDYVFVQDRSSRWMIGIRCESHALYQLQISAHVSAIMDSTSLIHLDWVILVLPRCKSLFKVCLMYLVYRVSRVS